MRAERQCQARLQIQQLFDLLDLQNDNSSAWEAVAEVSLERMVCQSFRCQILYM